MSFDFSSIFGEAPVLSKRSSSEVVTASSALQGKKVVGLLFNRWTGPTDTTVSKLKNIYNEVIKENPNDLEIVYIDACRTEKFYKKSCEEMPWFALQFEAAELKMSLFTTYGYRGTNAYLVFVDGQSGQIISKDGIKLISEFGMDAAPFTEEAIRRAKEPQNEAILQVFKDWTIFQTPETGSANSSSSAQVSVDIPSLLKKEVVAVLIAKNEGFNTYVKSKIDELHDRLGEGLAVIYIAYDVLDADINACNQFFKTLPSYWVKLRDTGDRFIEAISSAVDDVEDLNLFFLSGDSHRLLVPIDEDVSQSDVPTNFRLLNAMGEILEGDNAVEKLSQLELVGIYFGSFDSETSQRETAKLSKLYSKMKLLKKPVEIIYISNDSNITNFHTYLHTMPWLALDYSQTEYRAAANQAFNVKGVDAQLVWINVKSGDVNMNGLETIDFGHKYYPWSPELLEQARKSKLRSISSGSIIAGVSGVLNGSSCTIS